jgi:MFS family permease
MIFGAPAFAYSVAVIHTDESEAGMDGTNPAANPYAPHEWAPDERPTFPGSPSFPAHSDVRRAAYFIVGMLVTLTGGLGNALATVNLVNLQGTLGVTQAEINWLPAAYVMANVSMNLLLVKFRQQFGLRAFTICFLALYALTTFGHLFVNDLGSAIAVRAAHGMVGAALSTLGLYYTIQAFKKQSRILGILAYAGVTQLPQPIAYVFSSSLLHFMAWRGLYLFELGLALVTLAAVLWLPLPQGDRYRVFKRADFLTFALFAPGMALLTAALSFGRVLWWTDQMWIGVALAASIALLAAAFVHERRRAEPLLNLRWLTSGAIARMAVALVLLRVVLSEQSVGAVGLLRLAGLNNDEMRTLFAVVLAASAAAIGTSMLVVRPNRLVAPQVAALLIMACGAWIDAGADNLTRPAEMMLSQGLLAFGGVLFIGPLFLSLIGSVLANPSALITFSVLFGLTQNLGGVVGAALVGSFQIVRTRFHTAVLSERWSAMDPAVAARIAQSSVSYGRLLSDPLARAHQGAAALAASVAREANILAYDDVSLMIAATALLLAAWIGARALWARLAAHG